MKLWTWNIDCGRMGELTGAFFATNEELERALGYEIWLDEPLGKHSEITVELERDQFEALEISEQSIAVITEKFGITLSGFNPVEIAEEQREEKGE